VTYKHGGFGRGRGSPTLPLPLAATVVVGFLAVLLVAGPSVPATATPAAVAAPAPATTSGAAVGDRWIVGFEPGTPPAARAAAIARLGGVALRELERATVVTGLASSAASAHLLRRSGWPDGVAYVEPDSVLRAAGPADDPLFPSQWALENTGQLAGGQAGAPGSDISARAAWATTTGSSSVVVGVLDSGVELDHPDLAPNLWSNPGGLGGCPAGTHGSDLVEGDCTPSDGAGHGTHVAGIIGAVGGNGIGISGVSPHVTLLPLRMLDNSLNGTVSGAVAAIDRAVQLRAAGVPLRVLNASWTGTEVSEALRDALVAAGQAGIAVVAAAGNSGLDIDRSPSYPCSFRLATVVCVAASTNRDQLDVMSNRGVVTVDLAAPGAAVVSTWVGGRYASASGTSMAAPQATGVAALALAEHDRDPSALKADLLAAVDPVPDLAGTTASGGRLDACLALAGCRGGTGPGPVAALRARQSHGSVTLTWRAPASTGGPPLTGYTLTVSGEAESRPLPADATTTTVGGLTDNHTYTFSIAAVSGSGGGPPAVVRGQPLGGGYVLDGWGGLHPFAVGATRRPPAVTGAPYWRGWDIARSVALLPDGTGGYVLDGWGGVHRFAMTGPVLPPPVSGIAYTRGHDVARALAVIAAGSGGLEMEGSGRLTPIRVGDGVAGASPRGGPYWGAWDIARSFALLPGGAAGYVLDGWGGLHQVPLGSGATPPRPSGAPYWWGWDIARGVGL